MLKLIRRTARTITNNPIAKAIFFFSFILLCGVLVVYFTDKKEILDISILIGCLVYWYIILVKINEL